MPEEPDPIWRLIHSYDQLGAALETVAGPLWQFFEALTAKGFTREEALVLTEAALRVLAEKTARHMEGPE